MFVAIFLSIVQKCTCCCLGSARFIVVCLFSNSPLKFRASGSPEVSLPTFPDFLGFVRFPSSNSPKMSTRSPKTETQRKRRREGQDAPNSRARSKERGKKQRKKESKHNRWKRKLFTAVEIADCDKVERLIHQRSRKHIKEYLAEFNAQGLSAIHLAAGLGTVPCFSIYCLIFY